MNEIAVSTAVKREIIFGATGLAELEQNVWMILTCEKFSIPMNRDFAWDPVIDAPMNIAQAKMTNRIAAALRTFEPRVQLIEVTFQSDALNGVMHPIVRVKPIGGS